MGGRVAVAREEGGDRGVARIRRTEARGRMIEGRPSRLEGDGVVGLSRGAATQTLGGSKVNLGGRGGEQGMEEMMED